MCSHRSVWIVGRGMHATISFYGLHSLWCFGFRVLRGIRNAIVRSCGRVFGKSTSPFSADLTSEVVVPSDKTQLSPPAHLELEYHYSRPATHALVFGFACQNTS